MPAVRITDTTLRDGHQSLWATRMRIEEMLPIVEKLDKVGYHSLEVWGGATFDVCLRYLAEDPWERLRRIKERARNTPLQMLLRGQSLVGYTHYPDDIVEAFVERSVANGISIIRIFDALNDVRNMVTAVNAAKRAGAHVQATVVYTLSPVHSIEHFVSVARELVDLGADSICVKDMAGLLAPYHAFDLVKALKQEIGAMPVQLHCHYIGGMAVGAYLKAAEAGVDVVDTASVPLAFGASQPPVETVVRALRETPYDTGLDLKLLFEIAAYFENLRKERGFERGVTRINDMRVFDHQVPGGMITNLVSQLNEQRSLHRLDDVLAEIPRVRKELGYPPLVTPTSQIVGTQAVLNVLTGERYKLVPGEVKNYLAGLYGTPPMPVDAQLAGKVLGDRERVDCRPADLLEPRLEKMRSEIGSLAHSEEDVLSYALFPQVAKKYFEERGAGDVPVSQTRVCSSVKEADSKRMNLEEIRQLIRLLDETDIAEFSLESQGMRIAIKKGRVEVLGSSPSGLATPGAGMPLTPQTTTETAPTGPTVETFTVVAPMVGTFYRSPAPDAPTYVEVGDKVVEGQTVCIIEAMKLMNEIEVEAPGEIVEILVENGQPVEYGQALFVVAKESH